MATHTLLGGRLRRLPRGDGRIEGRRGDHPRRLPDQLRDQGPRAAPQVARLPDPRPAGRRRDRRRGGRAASRRPEGRAARPLDQARGQGDRVSAEGERSLPAVARADGRPQGFARPRLRPDGGADRAGRRRQAARALPGLVPPLRPGLRDHRRRPPRGRSGRSRRQARARAPRRGARQRRGRPARLLPGSPRQYRQGRDGARGPRRLPLRAPLRGAAGDARDARTEEEGPRSQGGGRGAGACARRG